MWKWLCTCKAQDILDRCTSSLVYLRVSFCLWISVYFKLPSSVSHCYFLRQPNFLQSICITRVMFYVSLNRIFSNKFFHYKVYWKSSLTDVGSWVNALKVCSWTEDSSFLTDMIAQMFQHVCFCCSFFRAKHRDILWFTTKLIFNCRESLSSWKQVEIFCTTSRSSFTSQQYKAACAVYWHLLMLKPWFHLSSKSMMQLAFP